MYINNISGLNTGHTRHKSTVNGLL